MRKKNVFVGEHLEIGLKVKDIMSESLIYSNKKLNYKDFLAVRSLLRRKLE